MNSSFTRHQDTNPLITLTTQMYIETREIIFLAIKSTGKKTQDLPYISFSSMPVVLSTCRKQPRSLLDLYTKVTKKTNRTST